MPSFLDTTSTNAPIIITEDGGGLVDRYLEAAAKYKEKNVKVIIHGSCRSACTVALSVPGVCVTTKAVVKFHQAYEVYTGKVRKDITKRMVDTLPLKIQSYISDKISRDYSEASTLDYGKLILLGVKSCGQYEMELVYSNKQTIASKSNQPETAYNINGIMPYKINRFPMECFKLIPSWSINKRDNKCRDIM